MKNNKWQEYLGDYEKQEYDIRLFDGTIYHNCWPNAGFFHTQKGITIEGEKVEAFRISD